MANLRSDSPICRRIVLSFLDFLNSVQPAPGVDLEGVDVARECLEEVFKLNSSSSDNEIKPVALIDLFSSMEVGEQRKDKSVSDPSGREKMTTSSSQRIEGSIDFERSNEDQVGASDALGGDSKDELLGNFLAALDKINFFKTLPGVVEESAQVAKATQFFNDALMEMENSEGQRIDLSSLAEMFKLRGNRFMQLKSYSEAIDLYTCAIALCERNAIYYCNRAAAYTQIHRYAEAIQDCLKSIEINPSYSKAYSRLGLAYYARGNYSDALNMGFLKALQLDPNNDSVKENIQVAVQKLMEQRHWAENGQNIGSNQGQATNNGPSFASFSFNTPIPPGFQFERPSSSGDPTSFFPFNPTTPPTQPEFSDAFTQSSGPNMSFSYSSSTPEFANMFRAASQAAGSTNSSTTFPSFSFNASTPTELADVWNTMARERGSSGASEGGGEPGIRMDGTSSFSFGAAPEQVSDVLRSVMGMFPQRGSQQDTNRDGN